MAPKRMPKALPLPGACLQVGRQLSFCAELGATEFQRLPVLTLLVFLSPGISAGILSFLSIRGGDHQYFFVCSQALEEVIEAQSLSADYEIMMSPTCWELCGQQRIKAQSIAGRRAMKVGEWCGLEPFGRPAPGRGAAERLNVATALTISLGREPRLLPLRHS